MVYVGIDIAKDKHDCCAIDSDGVVLCNSFPNSASGFLEFLKLTREWSKLSGKIKVGFESTGHYSTNLLSFLKTHDFEIVVLNPLSVSRFRSVESLRRTKTDKNNARYIAGLLMTDSSAPYREQSYQISVLKSITRARYRLNKEIQPLQNRPLQNRFVPFSYPFPRSLQFLRPCLLQNFPCAFFRSHFGKRHCSMQYPQIDESFANSFQGASQTR